MRFLRLLALFGSVILLVATLTSLVHERADLVQDRDDRASSAMTVSRITVQATVLRARAVAASATATTTPANLLTSFPGLAAACIDIGDRSECSGGDLTALDTYEPAAELSAGRQGEPVAVVDADSDTVLVVARRDGTVVVQLGLGSLIGSGTRDEIAAFGAHIRILGIADDLGAAGSIETSSIETGSTFAAPGDHVVSSALSEPFDSGTIAVVATVGQDIGWGAGAPEVYALLLALGTVLLGLAVWSYLAERRQLEQRATTDELTGLVNRREFERATEDAIEMAGRMRLGLCIMLIDLNGFKQINDTLGHQVGDLVLKSCADRLRDAVRDTDLVGRWGGDEFVVLLPGLEDASAVRDRAERISTSLSASPAAGDVTVSGSIGAALYPRHGRELDELMRAADEAMYEAKSAGVVHRLAETIPTGTYPAPSAYPGPERRRVGSHADDAEQPAPR